MRCSAPRHTASRVARVAAHGMSRCVSEAERKPTFPDPFARLPAPAARERVILQNRIHRLETGLASAIGRAISRSGTKKYLLERASGIPRQANRGPGVKC